MKVESGDGWEVRSGKWQESPPEMVDHTIADPPFTDHVSQNAAQRVSLARRQGTWVGDPKAAGLSFGGISPTEIGPAIVALTSRWSVLFCAIEQVGDYKKASPEAYVRGGWWAKTNASPQFTGDRPAAPGEAVAILHSPNERKRWNNGGHKAEWRGPSSHSTGAGPFDARVHETQKPLWLMVKLIQQFTDPGELIWDPYCGSGTTGVACLLTGRRFLGHELQDGPPHANDYFGVAVERLRAAERGQSLGEYKAGQLGLFEATP